MQISDLRVSLFLGNKEKRIQKKTRFQELQTSIWQIKIVRMDTQKRGRNSYFECKCKKNIYNV